MNKSFKVVFSKARSALMVVNEATSSIQAKGTKTVIAAAAAAMIAGGAMAEPTATPATAVTVGQDGVLTATTTMKDGTTTTAYAATGTVSVGTGADAYQWGSKADTVTDQLGDTSVVTLAGGSLVSVDTDQSVASIAGKGSLVINANTSAGAKITEETGLTDETTHDNLNIDMTVFNSKDGTVKAETTLTLAGNGARTLAAGTLKTAASDKSDGTANKGVAKVVANGDLTFGAEEVKTTNGSVTTPATAYNFDINADTEVSSTTGSVVHAAGKTTVAADTKLTFAASTQGKTVTIGKDVSFANAGLVSVQSSGAVFNANYDATANTGKLLITGAADKADTITIGGTIANGEVKVGDTFTTDSKTQAVTDTAAVALNGTTVAVSETGALKPATLTLAGGTLNVNGAVEATDTKVTGVAVLATQSGTVNQKTVYGSAKLGNVVVENAETQNTLSVSNADADNAITATSLTVKGATAAAGTAKATQGGKFTLTSGAFTAGTLSVGSGATVELTAGKFTVNGTGASTNEGTITLAASTTDNFVIGAGNELTNSGLIGGTAADSGAGSIAVAGTLVNVNKAATTDPKAAAVTGKIFAQNVTVEKGGVLETDFVVAGTTDKVYVAGTTTVEGTFKTALNARVDGVTVDADKNPADALALDQAFVLNGGDITDHAGTSIGNFVLSTGATLTVEADKTFTNVITSGGSFAVNDAVVTVGTLNLKSGGATVDMGGVLNVTDLKTAATQVLTVTDGSVNTSLAGLGLQVSEKAVKEKANAATVAANTISLAQNGTLVISDYQAAGTSATLTKAGLDGLTGKLATGATGLIDLGNVTIEDLKANTTTGYYAYTDVKDLGVATTTLKAATVSVADATAIERSQSFGNIFQEGTTGKLTVKNGTLTLNGTGVDSTGYLVAYTSGTGTSKTTKLGDVELGANASGGEFVVTGTGKVGNVKKATDAVDTALVVADKGDVTVVGDVEVDRLYVDAGAKLTVDPVASGTTGRSVTASEVEFDGTLVATDTTLTVNNTTDSYYTAATKTFNDISYVGGVAQVKKLDVKGDLLITGDVTVTDTLTGAANKTFYVGNDATAGKLVVNTMANNTTIFADPAWVNGQSQGASLVAVKTILGTDASVNAGRNSIVAIGTDKTDEAVAVFAKSGFKLAETSTAEADKVSAADTKTVNSVLYVNATNPYLGTASATDLTAATFGTLNNAGVLIEKNSMLALDAANIGTNSVFDKDVTLAQDSVLFVDNAKNGKQIKLSAGTVTMDGADLVYGGNLLMDLKQVEGTTGTLAFSMKDWNEVKDLYGNAAGMAVAYAMFEQGVDNNSSSATFNKWLYTDAYHDSYGSIRTAAKDVASLGATTGVQTMTMDAVNQMGETVADRVSVLTQRAAGVNVWAAANGGMFEAKSLFDGAGYESDIYSGVLGVDYQFACNAVLGAALTIGTADTDNKNSTVKASTDSDLVGFSVYTSKTFADVIGVSADIGYLTASNDVTANGYGQAWKFSQDTDAFTIGLRTEVLAEVGAVKLVPHIGIRYTALSTDGFEAGYKTEIDDQNIFQMPVGVTVSGDFQTGDWTVAPKFDLSVVPTFGDKDADLKLGITGVNATDDLAVRVIDSNPVQATLGVNATNGAWGFGLNYKLGVGSDDRMNNTFNVNVRYAF